MRDRLILEIPWRECIRNMTRQLSMRGLSVRRTFDLQQARRSLRNGQAAFSPLRESYQYRVLQVRCGRCSAAVVVRGDGNNTEITILKTDDSEDRVASEILNLYRNMKAESRYVFRSRLRNASRSA